MDWLKKNRYELLALLALIIILLVSADLRLFRADAVPGWYNDEGTVINAADNLAKGRIEYFGVQGSLLYPSRMPLFIWLLALAFRIFGTDILVLRLLTGSLGVINTAIIYGMLRKENKSLALFCALAFAIFPKAVLYARIGFSYNLLTTFTLLMFWACGCYLATGRRRYAAAAALALTLCLLSELVAVAYVPVLIIMVLWKRWKDLWFTLLIGLVPPLVYTLIMLWLNPGPYGADLQWTMSRVSAFSLPTQLVLILLTAGSVHLEITMLMGAIGVFLFPSISTRKRLVLFLFIPFIIFFRTMAVGELGWHYMIPLFPFYAIGWGALFYLCVQAVVNLCNLCFDQIFNRITWRIPVSIQGFSRAGGILAFLLMVMIVPLFFVALFTHRQINDNTLPTGINAFLADPADARATIEYLNGHAKPNDLILASPSFGWALKGNPTDYHITLAYMGESSTYFSKDTAHDRYRFDPTYTRARYIVIDSLWMNWGEANLSDLAAIRRFAEQQPPVFKAGQITVYQIPNP